MRRFLLPLIFILYYFNIAHSQTIPIPQSMPVSQNFSALPHSGTTYPAGWVGWTMGTSPGTSYSIAAPTADRLLIANSSASTSTGNIHNYNSKIGMLNTGSLDLALAYSINTIGKSNILLQYDAMTIRNPYDTTGNTRIHELGLQYRVGTTGVFTNLSGVAYQNNNIKQTSTGLTSPQNLQNRSIVLPPDCDNKDSVQIRWVTRQVSGAGLRPSFAIDNVKIDTASIMYLSLVNHAEEGVIPKNGQIKLFLSAPTNKPSIFKYDLSGSATFNVDYSLGLSVGASPAVLSSSSGTITLDSGIQTLYLNIIPINDALVEGMEKINFRITEAILGYVPKDSLIQVHLVDDELTPIHLIQGTGVTAQEGTYHISGIVTGVFPLLSPKGFYVEEEDLDADADINSSEGIFVVSDSMVHVGDKYEFLGDAYEGALFPSYSQATFVPSEYKKISSANPLPSASPISLPLTAYSDLEKYEGMLVRFVDTLTVTDNSNLGKFGELSLSANGVVYQPSQQIDPNDAMPIGTSASGASNKVAMDAYLVANSLRTILLDDGRASTMTTLPYINTDNTVRVGSTVDSLWGIMGYAYDQYRIQPISLSSVVIRHQPRPTVPDVGADASIKVASFNVLNYFNGDGFGGGFPTSRGANSLAEFARQRDKIIKAIIALNADIVGLIEIENDGVGAQSAIQNLANGINAYLGAGTYSIVKDGDTSQAYNTDEIRCGILYKSAVLDTLGVAMSSNDTVFNRPPLAQTFKVKSCDSVFTFIINHFKAKGCTGSKGLDRDQLDGQSCYNDTRKKQAASLVSFINNTVIPTSKHSNILSMGDYNSYFEEDPLDTIRASGFQVLSDANTYSYLYQGQLGSLDNAIVSNTFLPLVTDIQKWNINSVEPSFLDYEDDINDGSGDQVNFWSFLYSDVPFRCSDHDPVLVGLKLGKKLSAPIAQKTFDFSIAPNPTNDKLMLQWNTLSKVKIQLFDFLGKSLLQIETMGDNTSLDLSGLAAGMYMIRLSTAQQESLTKKFIKQ